MKKHSKSILKYLIEMVIVAFGVFLGVYFSNVNAENKTRVEKEKSLRIILEELQHNQQVLEKYIQYHERIKLQIDSISRNLSEEELFSNFTQAKEFHHKKIEGWNGFQFARLQKTAFESVKISGIMKEFDIELIQKISSVYSLQETYLDFGSSVLNKAISTNSETKVIDFIGVIQLMTSDLLGLEKELDKIVEKTIAELKTAQ